VANLNGDGRPDLIVVSYACADINGRQRRRPRDHIGDWRVRRADDQVRRARPGLRQQALARCPISEFCARTGPPSFVLDETWTDKLQSRLF
jgi:hypothetical protein